MIESWEGQKKSALYATSLMMERTPVSKKRYWASICGATVSLEKIFSDESLREGEITKFSFAEGIDDDKEEKLRNVLGERFELIVRLKTIFDWAVLSKILEGSESLSEAQVKSYEKHRSDLHKLKRLVRRFLPGEYKEIFSDLTIANNYVAYVGHTSEKGKAITAKRSTEQADFCDYIRKKFAGVEADDPELKTVKEELEKGIFMPKQVMKSNSAVPYQVHRQDLIKIINNMGKDYPALAQMDPDGLSVCDKILRIFEFRIPYYIGPLNGYHSNKGGNWVIRRRPGRVTPWNFDEMVDTKASAEAFIMRLTNKCTYLTGEDVLPKDSLSYSKYMVLNELNNLRINGNRLDVGLKQRIYEEHFKKKNGQVSLKSLKKWMERENIAGEDDQLSGIDDTFKSKLKSYHDFYKIIGSRVDTEPIMVESIIRNILIFGEDKKLLRERIKEKYGDKLTDDEIKQMLRLSYSDWGRFSWRFLNEITDVDHETGEIRSLLQAMWDGNENLMELLSKDHKYMEKIKGVNAAIEGRSDAICYEMVRETYASPAVKRGIWQTLLIVKEIQQVTGCNPARVFVEVARDKEKNPQRKESRQARLLALYKNIKDEARDWQKEIGEHAERDFASKKLYLYYTQMGRDMYSGDPIDLDELMTDTYDLDHIYPQSKTKDDSILSNLVLVRSEYNRDKSAAYPIPSQYRQEKLWKTLKDNELITKEKYERLVRREPLSEEELAGFIGRQLVETRQTTKIVTQILEQTIPESKIVYSKASNVSDFRKNEGFIKSRSVNDYHHAKDAYLNIVVGNVYYTKFTDNPLRYIKDSKTEEYSLNRVFDYNVSRGDTNAWVSRKNGTIMTVRKYMMKNNILFTRYATEKRGGFYDQMLLKKGSGQLVPIKSTDSRYKTENYGGYNKPGINYFMVVESDGKKGRKRTIEGVPVYLSNASKERLLQFCKEELGLINPDIRFAEIKINSLLKVDGYPLHVSGKSNARIVVKNAVQLCLSIDEEELIRRVDKVLDIIQENKKYIIDDHDGLAEEKMVGLYEALERKLESIYIKRHSAQLPVVKSGREKYLKMDMVSKCRIIRELLHLFQCNAITSDLSGIGGASHAGVLVIGNEISKLSSVRLVSQSVTGLFENETDLLTI